MPAVNTDVQPAPSIDGAALCEPIPSGFISVGAASSTTAMGVTAKVLEEMDERQLSAQVRFELAGQRET